MMHGPEGQEIFTDGVQPEDMKRVAEGLVESNPDASKEALEHWEEGQFGNKGDAPIDEEEQFRLLL